MHAVDELHDTPRISAFFEPLGFGTDCTAQEVPFHASANGTRTPELFVYSPPAVQSVAVGQETPDGFVAFAPVGAGIDCTVHSVPFHRSANGSSPPELFS